MNKPYIIDFEAIGDVSTGFLVTSQQAKPLPFTIKRVFWVFGTPNDIVRGQHAHFQTELMLVSVHGLVTIEVESLTGQKKEFTLSDPTKGLYLPVMHWTRIFSTSESVLLCLASNDYIEEDYIRDYHRFKALSPGYYD